MFSWYRDTVQVHLKHPTIYYPPSRANPSSTSKPKLSVNQWLNHEYNALQKLLTQWLGASAVKALVLAYSR
jgi:hypothetical protein